VADLSNPDLVAIWNLNRGALTLYVYNQQARTLQALYVVKYEAVQQGDTTNVKIPSRGLLFSMRVGKDAGLLLDGNPTKFARAGGDLTTEFKAVPAADTCGARSAAADAGTPRPSGPKNAAKPKPESIYCLWGLAYGDCCGSCFCVHRDLNLPEWVDNICCGGGC